MGKLVLADTSSPDYDRYVLRNRQAKLLNTPSLKTWSKEMPEHARYVTHHPLKRNQTPRNVLKPFEEQMPTKCRDEVKEKYEGQEPPQPSAVKEVRQGLRLNNELLQSDAVQLRLREIEQQIPQGFPNRQAIIDQLLNQFLQNQFTSGTVKPSNSEELNRLLGLYRGRNARSRRQLGRGVLERIAELLNVRSGDANVDTLVERIDRKLSGEQVTTRSNPPPPAPQRRRTRSETARQATRDEESEEPVQPQERSRVSRDEIRDGVRDLMRDMVGNVVQRFR